MTDLEIKKHLFSIRPLQYLGVSELDRLITYSEILRFLPGQYLLKQGKINEGMLILLQGEALVKAKILGKGLTHFDTLKEGDFTGEVFLIEKGPSAISVVAQNNLHCLLVTRAYFDMLSTFFPEMRHKIMRGITEVVCNRLTMMHGKISDLMQESNIADRFILDQILTGFVPAKKTTLVAEKIDMRQLKQLGIFNIFTQSEYEELLRQSTLIKIPKKFPLIQQNEKNGDCYLILRGAVQVNVRQENKIAKLAVIGPLTLFSSTTLLNDNPSIFSFISCEQSLILKIDAENIAVLKNNHVDLWYKLFGLICKSIVASEKAADKLFTRLNSEIYT